MKLLFKILRSSLNVWQIAAFSVANMVGLAIVILGVYIYRQVSEIGENGNSVVQDEYLVVSKPVTAATTLATAISRRQARAFSDAEIAELKELDGVTDLTCFTSSHFTVTGSVELMGTVLSTDMFLEAIPDRFLDVQSEQFKAGAESETIPVIVPRSYLELYNYGFAASQGLPQVAEGFLSMLRGRITIRGNGKEKAYRCKLAAFSDRINSILVPEDFLKEMNRNYSGGEEPNPARVILKVDSGKFPDVIAKIHKSGFNIEGEAEMHAKLSSALKMTLIAVTSVGAVLTVLAFALLLISILLMIEKNRSKNDILHELGYRDKVIAVPYQAVAVISDLISVAVSLVVTLALEPLLARVLSFLQPDYEPSGPVMMVAIAAVLAVFLCLLHSVTIRLNLRSGK